MRTNTHSDYMFTITSRQSTFFMHTKKMEKKRYTPEM